MHSVRYSACLVRFCLLNFDSNSRNSHSPIILSLSLHYLLTSFRYARVSVYFQRIYDDEEHADDFVVVPDSEFIVTRTAYNDNSSTYALDGKSSNFKLIGQILSSHGIDLDNNRFLILQGEVEQIAMMKPKGETKHEDGLLEYLEDIIGSTRFKDPIEEMNKDLEEINEKRTEKVNRTKVAEKDRDNLKGAKEEAQTYLDLERDVQRKQNVLYQVNELQASKNADAFSENMQEKQDSLAAEREKIAESDRLLKEKESEYEKMSKKYKDVFDEKDQAVKRADEMVNIDTKLRLDRKANKEKMKKCDNVIDVEGQKETNALKAAESASEQAEDARSALQGVEEKKVTDEAEVEQIMAGMREATTELRAQLEGAQEQLADAERDIAAFQTDKETVSTAIDLVKSRAANATVQLQKLTAKREKIVQEREEAAQRVNVAGEEKGALEREVQELEIRLLALEDEEGALQTAVREAIGAFEHAQEMLKASGGSSSAVLQNIINARKKGGPLAHVAVHGRLGDLGCIPKQFDVAVSTACGLLDHIVTDTAEDAQACMEFLRERRLGRCV